MSSRPDPPCPALSAPCPARSAPPGVAQWVDAESTPLWVVRAFEQRSRLVEAEAAASGEVKAEPGGEAVKSEADAGARDPLHRGCWGAGTPLLGSCKADVPGRALGCLCAGRSSLPLCRTGPAASASQAGSAAAPCVVCGLTLAETAAAAPLLAAVGGWVRCAGASAACLAAAHGACLGLREGEPADKWLCE
jgi:hypothetical protein